MKTILLIVFGAVSLVVGLSFLVRALYVYKVGKRAKRVLSAIQVYTIGVFASVVLIFVPIYYTSYDFGDAYNFFRPLLIAIHNSLRIFILDGDFDITVNSLTRTQIAGFYKSHGYKEYMISEAGMRGLFFYANYNESNNELVVVDVPTSITASYVVVKSVLSIDSDDDYDVFAEERFATKELDVYAFALSKLLTYDVAKERLSFIKDALKKESVLKKLEDVSICVMDISK